MEIISYVSGAEMNRMILFLILWVILLIVFIVGFIYQIKLVRYLQKHKPALFDKLVMKKERYVIETDKSLRNKTYAFSFKHIYPRLPTHMKMDVTFSIYLFSKNKEDDSTSRLYKRIVAFSLIIFITGILLDFIYFSVFLLSFGAI